MCISNEFGVIIAGHPGKNWLCISLIITVRSKFNANGFVSLKVFLNSRYLQQVSLFFSVPYKVGPGRAPEKKYIYIYKPHESIVYIYNLQ